METSIKLKHLVIAVGLFLLYTLYDDHTLLHDMARFLSQRGQ